VCASFQNDYRISSVSLIFSHSGGSGDPLVAKAFGPIAS
jgi:hypothetical protein